MSEQIPQQKQNYVNNKDLLAEVIRAKELGRMTEELGKMLKLLCERYSRRGQFVDYTYNEDMQGYALLMLVHTWQRFDHTRFKNPFAFYTECVKNSFKQYLIREKKRQKGKDEYLIRKGLNPSFNYTEDHVSPLDVDDEQNLAYVYTPNHGSDYTAADASVEESDAGSSSEEGTQEASPDDYDASAVPTPEEMDAIPWTE